MTPEQREKAATDLTLTYLGSYYSEWRLTKVLTNKKILEERYQFYADLIENIKQWDDKDGEATIAQEIRNGLYFDSIAQCIQYIEDLFALIKASKKPDYFIRNIITYKAGKITDSIKSFKTDIPSLSRAFHFPEDLPFENSKAREGFDLGIKNLANFVSDLLQFYKDFQFFYNQYKHGLAVGMRPHGNKYGQEQIKKDKNGELKPYLAVYDNLNLKDANKKGTFTLKNGAFMPGFTDNVRPFIGELEKQNNYLRLVFPPDFKNFSHDLLEDTAFKTRRCLNTFIANYIQKITSKGKKELKFQLPTEDFKNDMNYITTYENTL